jgi:hypothetical protein
MPLRSGSCFLEDDIIEPLMLLKPSSLSHVLSMPDSGSSLVECAAQMLQCGQVCGVWVCSCVCVCVFMFVHAFIHNNRLRKEGGRSEATITPLGQQQVCVYLPAVSA